MPSSSPFLSTLSPGRGERRAALCAAAVSLLVFALAAPFAKQPLTAVSAFLPIYQSALVLNDLVTAILLLGQVAIMRSRALLALACGYLFSAAMAVAHALSFPGLFAPAGLLGGGSQTTAWLYFLWHAGFPLFIVAYAVLKDRVEMAPMGNVRPRIIGGVVGVIVLAGLLALAAAGSLHALPPLMAGNVDAPMKVTVATITWLLAPAALYVLWRRGPHSVLDLWLMVVLCAWAADSALASVLNHGRYDVGWYAGRVYGLLASTFVLAILLLESSMLYARLAQAHVSLADSSQALGRAVAQLEIANRDLSRFAGALAHDLQQPMLSIGGYARIVRENSAHLMRPVDVASLQRIIGAAEHADRMIQGLLQFARLGQKEIDLVPVDLNQVVRDACEKLSAELEARAVAYRVAPLPAVRGDPELLLLAFVNLLSNGIKYTRHREEPTIDIDVVRGSAEGHAAVRITDNGVGFDMSHASRLFTPFERLHSAAEFEGTGMGLANVWRIMERHGGSVHAEAAPGQGATFILSFRG